MKGKKYLLLIITVLFSVAFIGCGSRTVPVSERNSQGEISLYIHSQYVMAERNIGSNIKMLPIVLKKNEAQFKENTEVYMELKELPGLIRTFRLEDFYAEEIACGNVLENPLNGKENPELLALYAETGEEPKYLYYAEFDFNGDGVQDYIAVYSYGGTGTACYGDIWLNMAESSFKPKELILDYYRCELPKLAYLTGGNWQNPEFFMMVLQESLSFNGIKNIAAYANSTLSELVMYGSYFWTGQYRRMVAADFVTQVEVLSKEMIIEERIYQAYDGYETAPVRLCIKEANGEDFFQVLYTERIRCSLSYLENESIVIWDANEDGHEDILYFQGINGGSGGTFDFYSLFNWSEEEKQYVEADFPMCTWIDFEEHKAYCAGQSGVSHQIYEIFAVKDGEWQIYKRLDLMYEVGGVDQAVYYEWGEEVEITDITGLDWKEQEKLLERKYPEFNFWRAG
ncbi:MAG: hypothetical protein J1E83_07670 [Lachnospiraceae bacterium]|nr:hypothetical protein [Lachnospiraceae bacterium]